MWNRQAPDKPVQREVSTKPSDPQPADRSLQSLRSVAVAEMSALFALELDRYRDAWRTTFESVKGTLAELERACDAAMGRNPVEATAALSSLIERLVVAATAAADAAAQRARAETRAELAQVQATLADAQAELQKERDQLKALAERFEKEQSARSRAEAALTEAEKTRQEVSRLQQQLETEKSERTRLIAAIHQIVGGAAQVPIPPAAAPAPAVEPQKPKAEPKVEKRTDPIVVSSSVAPAAQHASAVDSDIDSEPELVTYVQHLLDTAEELYRADVAARCNPNELLERLTERLRSARQLFLQRVGLPPDSKNPTLFDQQVSQRLSTTENDGFGRHLGIAAYDCLSEPSRRR